MDNLENILSSVLDLRIKKIYYAEPINSNVCCGHDVAQCIRLAVPLAGCHRMQISVQGGRSVQISPVKGEAVFMPHHCWNCPSWDMEVETITFIFINNLVYANWVKSVDRKPVIIEKFHSSLKYSPETSQVLELMDNILRSSKTDARCPCLSQVLMISALEDLKKGITVYQKKSDTTWQAIEHFTCEHFSTNIARSDIAEAFKLSPNYVSALCYAKRGETYNQYLNQLRVNHAAKLLKESSCTISEIAYLCGYSGTSYFCKVFRKRFASSPQNYRLTHM